MAIQEMKAIPTGYAGHTFRSRTEARWAVFFDQLDLRWEYEPEGVVLGDGSRYLPDFWMPDMHLWIEVKPSGEVEDDAWKKAEMLVELLEQPVLVLNGLPWPVWYEIAWRFDCVDEPLYVGREKVCWLKKNGNLWYSFGEHESYDASVDPDTERAMRYARAIKLDVRGQT